MSLSKIKICSLVSLLILGLSTSCRERSKTSNVAGEKDESKTESFEGYFTQKLSALSPENKESLYKALKIILDGYVVLSREALLKQAIELYAEIYVKNQKDLDVNSMSESEKAQLTQSVVKYATIRHIFDKRSKTDPAYSNIVRELFNKTAGQRYHIVKIDGQKQKVEYENYNKISFERFDDVRVTISNLSVQQIVSIGTTVLIMIAAVTGFGFNQEGFAKRQPVGPVGYTIAAAAAIIGVILIISGMEESEEN